MPDILLKNGTILTGFTKIDQCCVLLKDGKIADVFSIKRLNQKKISPEVLVYDAGGAYNARGF